MDVVGDLFGMVITKREKGQSDLIDLYIEDDETYFHKQTFAAFWLDDLIAVVTEAKEKADTEVIFPE